MTKPFLVTRTRSRLEWAHRIATMLAEMGITQLDLAHEIGVTPACVCKWVGAKSKPTVMAQRALIALYEEKMGRKAKALRR